MNRFETDIKNCNYELVNIDCNEQERIFDIHIKAPTLEPIQNFSKLMELIEYVKDSRDARNLTLNFSFTYDDLSKADPKLYVKYLEYFATKRTDYEILNMLPFASFENGNFIFHLLETKTGSGAKARIVSLFKEIGIDVNVLINVITKEDIQNEQEERTSLEQQKILAEIEEQKSIAQEQVKIKEAQKHKATTRRLLDPANIQPIKAIPASQSGIDEYTNTVGRAEFTIKGEVFARDSRKTRNDSYLYYFCITDYTDSIKIKKFVTEDEKKAFDAIADGDVVLVSGNAHYDNFDHDVVLDFRKLDLVGKNKKDIRTDDAEVKRVELHLHTKMSALDAVTEASDYIKRAKAWGHKALAFTDHDGLYAYHTIMKDCAKAEIKPLYGVELGFVDENKFNMAYTKEDIMLKDATYVVFDLETTGFSVVNDKIIQIGALKVYQGQTIDSFNYFVNPGIHIPAKISNLTSITDDMVRDAETIDTMLPKFLDFIGDSILVAQNASFDVSHIYANMKRLGIPIKKPFPVIDTMQLARNFYSNDLKTFNLKSLAKYFKVNQEHHHLADDDTRVTAEIFIQMLPTLYKNNIYNYQDINSSIDLDEAYKHIVPSHINILVQNQTGYRNLFKIVSDALTTHFYGESRVLKSVLDQNREGLLIGSGCRYGEVFECALNKDDEELERVMSYYDYIEVQPKDIYVDMLHKVEKDGTDLDDTDYYKLVSETIIRIVNMADKLGKIVVATGDVHFLDKEQKQYRDIYISAPQLGGGIHPLANAKKTPDCYFRTTDEMLDAFAFLGKEKAYEIVVTNTNKIADMIEEIVAFRDGKDDLYSPADDEFKDSLGVPSIKDDLIRLVYETAYDMYGNPLPKYVQDRLDKELGSIINNGYSPIYYMAYLLVKKSNDDGYVVGSRGSVGSSLVATMMKITEVNPLAPHYYCPKCHFSAFKFSDDLKALYETNDDQKKLEDILQSVGSGYDLPPCDCPKCGTPMKRDGQDIPFETFLGFSGDKTPDIDLNFSGDYQPNAHEYVRTLMGVDHAFRAGTVATVAENTAIGYVKGYLERKNLQMRNTEIIRIAKSLEGVRRTTGQHPGGIVVVPSYKEIYDVTPIQYPSDKTDNNWRTTHFQYHDFEANLLKLDILGHDDPTTIRHLFDYVEAHPDEFPFSKVSDIPIDDQDVYRMFYETSVLGLKPEEINCEVATFAIPEFGTATTRKMLVDTKPKNFADLVKISGLAHGTDVWASNTQELVLGNTDFGKIPFSEVIGCRDDIMVYLIEKGMKPKEAFDIMEFVRKGKAAKGENPEKWAKFTASMHESNIPEWYIWSCSKIQYMFPKAHAVAYVMSAVRIAWFKLHRPLVFYSAFFSIRAGQFEPEIMLSGVAMMRTRIQELQSVRGRTAKEDDLLTMYQVAVEFSLRGLKFLPVDVKFSQAVRFEIEGNALRLPFVAVPGLGDSVAKDIVAKREEKMFTSKADVMKRTRLNKTLFDKFETMHAFNDLKDEDEEVEFGLFGIFE